MQFNGEYMKNIKVMANGIQLDIDEIDINLGEVRISGNGWADFDKVDFYINLGEDEPYVPPRISPVDLLVEEKAKLEKEISKLTKREDELAWEENQFKLKAEAFEQYRAENEARLKSISEDFNKYVAHTMHNLNKVLENIKYVDKMKEPTEQYLKYEESVLKGRAGGLI